MNCEVWDLKEARGGSTLPSSQRFCHFLLPELVGKVCRVTLTGLRGQLGPCCTQQKRFIVRWACYAEHLFPEIISFPSSCETTGISHPGCLHLDGLGVLGQAKCITHISELGKEQWSSQVSCAISVWEVGAAGKLSKRESDVSKLQRSSPSVQWSRSSHFVLTSSMLWSWGYIQPVLLDALGFLRFLRLLVFSYGCILFSKSWLTLENHPIFWSSP